MWGLHMDSGWSWWLMAPMTIGFWLVVIWMFSSITRSQRQYPDGTTSTEDAQEIAAKRYAAGEISGDEYSRIMERLNKKHERT